MRGMRCIRGQQAEIRAVLYMATLVASRHKPVIAEYYKHLVAKDKKTKVASLRKMLTMLNAVMSWSPVSGRSLVNALRRYSSISA
jgi:transposase